MHPIITQNQDLLTALFSLLLAYVCLTGVSRLRNMGFM